MLESSNKGKSKLFCRNFRVGSKSFYIEYEKIDRQIGPTDKATLSAEGFPLGHIYYITEGFEKTQVIGCKIQSSHPPSEKLSQTEILKILLQNISNHFNKKLVLSIPKESWDFDEEWEMMKSQNLIEIPKDCYARN